MASVSSFLARRLLSWPEAIVSIERAKSSAGTLTRRSTSLMTFCASLIRAAISSRFSRRAVDLEDVAAIVGLGGLANELALVRPVASS